MTIPRFSLFMQARFLANAVLPWRDRPEEEPRKPQRSRSLEEPLLLKQSARIYALTHFDSRLLMNF